MLFCSSLSVIRFLPEEEFFTIRNILQNKRFKNTSPKSFFVLKPVMFFTSFYERKPDKYKKLIPRDKKIPTNILIMYPLKFFENWILSTETFHTWYTSTELCVLFIIFFVCNWLLMVVILYFSVTWIHNYRLHVLY